MQFRHEPVALILTRQAVPIFDRTKYAAPAGVQRGAYVLAYTDDGKPEVLLLGTGSEVSLCIEAFENLKAQGIKARVVSMPSWEIFEHYCREHPEYREQVLPESVTARSRWKRRPPSAGRAISAAAAVASAWRLSALRPLLKNCRRSSASPQRTLSRQRGTRSLKRENESLEKTRKPAVPKQIQ